MTKPIIITARQAKLLTNISANPVIEGWLIEDYHDAGIKYKPTPFDLQKVKNAIEKLKLHKTRTNDSDLICVYTEQLQEYIQLAKIIELKINDNEQ